MTMLTPQSAEVMMAEIIKATGSVFRYQVIEAELPEGEEGDKVLKDFNFQNLLLRNVSEHHACKIKIEYREIRNLLYGDNGPMFAGTIGRLIGEQVGSDGTILTVATLEGKLKSTRNALAQSLGFYSALMGGRIKTLPAKLKVNLVAVCGHYYSCVQTHQDYVYMMNKIDAIELIE